MRVLIGLCATALALGAAGCGQDTMTERDRATGPMDQPADTGPAYTPPADPQFEPQPEEERYEGMPPEDPAPDTTPPGDTTPPPPQP